MSDVATQGAASVIGLHPNDNVLVASARIPAGAEVAAEGVLSLEAVATGKATIPEKGAEILDHLLEVASGRLSKSERWAMAARNSCPG